MLSALESDIELSYPCTRKRLEPFAQQAMELPSMVQRSGDTLIVRSVVSGNQLYLDQVKNASPAGTSGHSPSPNRPQHHASSGNTNNSPLEQQLESFRAAAAVAQQQHYLQQQQQNVSQQLQLAAQQQAALELKDEGLPQCKIKRNYSCTYCTYFTQNPRYHLTHLRDVHGEKIVINKCKLCLYASRHFQKLVRHMKMVHGCTDGITGAQGQTRGKRGMNREARKRKLEQSVGVGVGVGTAPGGSMPVMCAPEMPTLEQVKRELELQEQKLQRDIQAFNKQQEEHKQQQQLATNAAEAIFAAAYECQLQAQQQRELEAIQTRSASDGEPTPRKLPSHDASYPVAAHQQHGSNATIEIMSSPSHPSSPAAVEGSPSATATNTHNSPAALSLSYADEAPQNRLLKCSICEFTTLYRAQLVDHELEEHCKTKFFRCEKCSYVTHIKARFSKHVKYHSMPMIKCDSCDFRTPYKWNLDRHMKNHGGTGPFKCAACDFTADIKQSLTVHEMNHHVPPVGHAAGMSLARRRNKVGGTDLCDDFLDSVDLLEDHYNNNNLDEYEEGFLDVESYPKKCKYDDEEPTDLSQKGGSSDTSSVHNQSAIKSTPKSKRPVPNLIPIPALGNSVLNLSKDLAASRSSLTEIASMFFNEKQLSEMFQPLDKSDAAQLSPTTTITSSSSHNSRNLLQKKALMGGNFFDKLKSSALTGGGTNENLICPCGHMAKCLSESIIHRKTCNINSIAEDDIDEEQDDTDGRLEIDFADDDDKQSHSALNLSVTGSTRCQHCRHRCKSSADLLNHLKQCSEAGRCSNESFDSLSGESSVGRCGIDSAGEQHHPMENRVFIWNKMPRSDATGGDGIQAADQHHGNGGGDSSGGNGGSANEENSYYGVETAPGYGEVTKKMTPEEEAANSSLKKVYKCPHCSFWASTASRFHVHIVGHLNKKPFECSLCSYRSNWRWDITKHIRLKTIRDPSHKSARVLMNDETGRRNYTKYNKYITLMKVTEEDGDPKLMKSGEMTPNQVATLAFVNDFNKNISVNGLTGTHLNGVREDITLEPIIPKAAASDGGVHKLGDDFIRLPLLATMMNAAMATQQQQQKEHDQQHTTLITPSVTISAVKRTPPPAINLTDDLIIDVKLEGSEKKTYFKCRKCGFRHVNRDAVLAHIKVHYQDGNYPIVTATATTSQKGVSAAQQNHTTPLQVAVSSNLYMNKVFAAMCLSQQQQNSNSSANNQKHQQQQQQQQQQHQQHSILSAGLLQQAIQGTPPNSPLSGLALALAGKSPTKPTTSILEHGEQKASHNEASAQSLTSPTIPTTCLSSSSSASLYNSTASGGAGGGSSSLQHLLTSPRGTYSSHVQYNQQHSTTTGSGAGASTTNCNNNSNLVIGVTGLDGTAATYNTGTTATAAIQQTSQSSTSTSPSPTSSSSTTSAIVTTLPTTPTTTTTTPTSTTNSSNHNTNQLQLGFIGANISHSPRSASAGNCGVIGAAGGGGDSVCIGGVVYDSNNSTLISHVITTSNSTPTTTTTTTSSNLLLNSATNATTIAAAATSSSQSSSATNFNNINNSNHNLLSNDSERRDPSPYRCGHCHQVSNWKHVIQRHCRLKHAGDIRIETLDRSAAVNERNAPPIYRPLCNGASNETNYGMTLKALQQQHQTNFNNNNNNSVLMNKNDHLLHSPLSAAANAANTPQDLQAAAAAYLAAAYKAATANASARNGASNAAAILGRDEFVLQQQLQQNDQIEITRLPPSASSSSNLAQLLESGNTTTSAQQNSKSKQQKCPQCPYISESKSQMNYHISLHKPTQYECHLCSFVCAKKQHLSSHMRSVHQQQNSGNGAGSGGGLNLDFSVALQLAAAVQTQQDASALAIDLTALRSSLNAGPALSQQPKSSQHSSAQQLPAEYQFKLISYCPRCPARYAQKHNDTEQAKQELAEHMKAHTATSYNAPYKCEFCDFRAAHEGHMQAHRYVHTQQYQEKYNERFKNCKEDVEWMAPKLMQITLRKSLQNPETIWIVDNELSEQSKQQQQPAHHQQPPQQPQSSNISSSTSTGFDNANSLLKKQLEAGPAPMPNVAVSPRNSPSPKAQDADESSNTPSTSASIATSDLAGDAGSDSASMANSPAPLEKCLHCPYETTNASLYKTHLQHHICISNQPEAYICEHCDYTVAEQEHIEEHTRVHFNSMEKLKSVAFFTSYDHLELSVEPNVDQDQNTPLQSETDASEYSVKIKLEDAQEHNNNNEENAINENTVNEQQLKQQTEDKAVVTRVEGNATPTQDMLSPTGSSTESTKRPSNKIILYKNDGCLSVKKEPTANNQNSSSSPPSNNNSDNISDRLRRRISRNHSSHLYGSSDEHQQSHKTILVNAKTGQVINRN